MAPVLSCPFCGALVQSVSVWTNGLVMGLCPECGSVELVESPGSKGSVVTTIHRIQEGLSVEQWGSCESEGEGGCAVTLNQQEAYVKNVQHVPVET